MSARSYWIGVVSKAHAYAAIGGGYVELNHGKAAPLERMREGDGVALYSPRTSDPDGERVQAFTAIGRVTGSAIVQAHTSDGFSPFRRSVHYWPANDAPIKPLIEPLSFIRSKLHWGAPFRFGFIRVSESDFAQIARAMGRDFGCDFPPMAAPSPPAESRALPA
jgi:EVE domain-containing protein